MSNQNTNQETEKKNTCGIVTCVILVILAIGSFAAFLTVLLWHVLTPKGARIPIKRTVNEQPKPTYENPAISDLTRNPVHTHPLPGEKHVPGRTPENMTPKSSSDEEFMPPTKPSEPKSSEPKSSEPKSSEPQGPTDEHSSNANGHRVPCRGGNCPRPPSSSITTDSDRRTTTTTTTTTTTYHYQRPAPPAPHKQQESTHEQPPRKYLPDARNAHEHGENILPLHSNGDMSYTSLMKVGSGRDIHNMLFDTGSSTFWVMDQNCRNCNVHGGPVHHLYDPSIDKDFREARGRDGRQQRASLKYGTGDAEGFYGFTTLDLFDGHENGIIKNHPILRVEKVDDTYLPNFEIDGIAGLGFRGLNQAHESTVFQAIAEQHDLEAQGLQPIFHFEMTTPDGESLENGHIVFGVEPTDRWGGDAPGYSTTGVIGYRTGWNTSSIQHLWWQFGTNRVQIGDMTTPYVEVNDENPKGAGVAMVDSGSSCIVLTEDYWVAFQRMLQSKNLFDGANVLQEVCRPENLNDPSLQLAFTIDGYVYKLLPRDYCVVKENTVWTNQVTGEVTRTEPILGACVTGGGGRGDDAKIILGDVFHRAYYLAYYYGVQEVEDGERVYRERPKVLITRKGAVRDTFRSSGQGREQGRGQGRDSREQEQRREQEPRRVHNSLNDSDNIEDWLNGLLNDNRHGRNSFGW